MDRVLQNAALECMLPWLTSKKYDDYAEFSNAVKLSLIKHSGKIMVKFTIYLKSYPAHTKENILDYFMVNPLPVQKLIYNTKEFEELVSRAIRIYESSLPVKEEI